MSKTMDAINEALRLVTEAKDALQQVLALVCQQQITNVELRYEK